MTSNFKLQKRLIIGALLVLVFADIALAAYSWRLSSVPRNPQQELALQTKQFELLRADIKRAIAIRGLMPAIQKDCEQFERALQPVATGYSSVSAEMDAIAKKAGVKIDDRTFRRKEIANRGLEEVVIDATVNGDYISVVRFLNGLQRSHNLYVVDGLSLAGDTQNQSANGPIRVAVHMKTYFRVS
ncbi:MAG TPA: hypothetical protein VOA64_08815 [Candidatus Dormibacteraeota bacterium]|nr:hypothetical protein [Candidatus Dormibacteraeota bacterium]